MKTLKKSYKYNSIRYIPILQLDYTKELICFHVNASRRREMIRFKRFCISFPLDCVTSFHAVSLSTFCLLSFNNHFPASFRRFYLLFSILRCESCVECFSSSPAFLSFSSRNICLLCTPFEKQRFCSSGSQQYGNNLF